jgi:hypothetical protein
MANDTLQLQLQALLYRYDLMELGAIGAPADEYSPEANLFIEWLQQNPNTDVDAATVALCHVFAETFDTKMAGCVEHYRPAAEEVLQLWRLAVK